MFTDIAHHLLYRSVLIIAGEKYQIFEIEFYVNDYKIHLDTFTQGLTAEKSAGKWLIEKLGRGNQLMLTIGEAVQKGACGSVLIRSVVPL